MSWCSARPASVPLHVAIRVESLTESLTESVTESLTESVVESLVDSLSSYDPLLNSSSPISEVEAPALSAPDMRIEEPEERPWA